MADKLTKGEIVNGTGLTPVAGIDINSMSLQRCGRVATFSINISHTRAFSNGETMFTNMPSGFIPSKPVFAVGVDQNKTPYVLAISDTGVISANGAIPDTWWLAIYVTYLVGG